MTAHYPPAFLRRLTPPMWVFWVVGSILLFALDTVLPLGLMVFWLLALLLCEFALLARYYFQVGRWRAIILIWLIYSLARFAATISKGQNWDRVVGVTMLFAVYAVLAGWFAILALAIRRDVSVAYFALFIILAPVVLGAAITAAGSVQAVLLGSEPNASFQRFAFSEPIVMALTCMQTLAFLTFVPHFAWVLVKEWQRAPLR